MDDFLLSSPNLHLPFLDFPNSSKSTSPRLCHLNVLSLIYNLFCLPATQLAMLKAQQGLCVFKPCFMNSPSPLKMVLGSDFLDSLPF